MARDLRALSLPDQSAALQVMGSPVPIRTINKSDITGVRMQALAIASAGGALWGSGMALDDIFADAERIVQWALRPATPEEEAAANGSR